MRTSESILLVEDQFVLALRQAKELEALGYSVSIAASGEEAVQACRSETPDLVLMDINLGPGMDGTEAAKIILAEKDIPLIFLSSHTEPEIVEKTLNISSYGYVVKNSGQTVLLASIRTAFNLHRTRLAHNKSTSLMQLTFDTMTEGLSLNEAIYDGSGNMVNYRVLMVNRAYYKHADYDRSVDPVGQLATDVYQVSPETIREFGRKSIGRTSTQSIEYRSIVSGRDLMLEISPIVDGRFVVSFIDITKRKRDERRLEQAAKDKETLLREVYHRVKNSLGSITGLVDLQLSSIKDEGVRRQVSELGARIRSIALVHQLLSHSNNLATISVYEYLSNLLDHLRESFAGCIDVEIKLEIDRLYLPLSQAVPCGLIVNEAITNAVKYAFPSDWEGRGEEPLVVLRCRAEGSFVVLEITDNGVGLPENFDPKKSDSLGFQLITLLSETQLGGRLEIFREKGLRYRVRFELGEGGPA